MNTSVLSPARIAPRLWPATKLPVFASTLFLSAGLMFLVEPMVAKMVLPRLGGAAAVWSACLVFFQTMLLLCLCSSCNETTAALGTGHTSRLCALAVIGRGAAASSWRRRTTGGAITRLVAPAAPYFGMRRPCVRHLGDRTATAALVRRCGP
jgi:hypothetical protein